MHKHVRVGASSLLRFDQALDGDWPSPVPSHHAVVPASGNEQERQSEGSSRSTYRSHALSLFRKPCPMSESLALRTQQGSPRHRLDPLLAPRCIALVGASTRPETSGNDMVRMAVEGGFQGHIYPINPKYTEVEGLPCYASLQALPEVVDHVVLGVANHRLEQSLRDAIAHGAKAATIFGSCYLADDGSPNLKQRLIACANEGEMILCGPNCMGFVNLEIALRVAAYPCGPKRAPGGITWIAQSGSVYGALAYNDERLKFNLAVSSGSEFITRSNDYMQWALQRPSTRVIALFLESVRDPEGFAATLAEAASRQIPVVILKAGRTPQSAAMARTHTGALAGDDAAYQALFDRYGVLRVHTLDELAATLILLSNERRAGPGGLASIHDSGGECELLIDLAADVGVPIASIGDSTKHTLSNCLEPGLKPVNPLDAWGTGHNAPQIFERCLAALMADPDTAAGLIVSDMRDGHWHHRNLTRVALAVAAQTSKPLAFATNFSMVTHRAQALALTESGVPVLDGTRESLQAIKHSFDYRDFLARPRSNPPNPPRPSVRAKWLERLGQERPLAEAECLALLEAYGIAVPRRMQAESMRAALDGADSLGYPVVLKTAELGIEHKSEVSGVYLNLSDRSALETAYEDLHRRLGPRVMVAQQVTGDVEVALGIVNDPQFGPFVMLSAGGLLVELMADHAVAMVPIDDREARVLVGRLALRTLLAGVRGKPPCDMDALCRTVSRLSVLAADLHEGLSQLDVNPVIVSANGCVAVDALVIGSNYAAPI